MNINKEGATYSTSLITGPTHNTLSLEFSPIPHGQLPIIAKSPSIGSCRHGNLDETEILHEVLAGIKLANQELDTNYCPSLLRYIENDTPRKGIYSVLAYQIVVYHHKNP